jgi:hypothetical protein
MNVTVIEAGEDAKDQNFAKVKTGAGKVFRLLTGKTLLSAGSAWRLRMLATGEPRLEMRPDDIRRLKALVSSRIAAPPDPVSAT